MDILVKKHYTPLQVKREELARTEFRPSRFTSGSARLDNLIALGKALLLCTTHSRKFKPFKSHYMAHPDPQLKRAHGRCDICQQLGLHHMFLNEEDGMEQRDKVARFQRALEYGKILNG